MDIQSLVSSIASGGALNDMAAKAGLSPDQAQAALHGVLDHATGGGLAEDLVGNVAAKTGLDPSQIQQFLPSVMGLLQGHAANAPDGGGLAGILGSLGGGAAAGGDQAAAPGAGIMGMISGLFGKKT